MTKTQHEKLDGWKLVTHANNGHKLAVKTVEEAKDAHFYAHLDEDEEAAA